MASLIAGRRVRRRFERTIADLPLTFGRVRDQLERLAHDHPDPREAADDVLRHLLATIAIDVDTTDRETTADPSDADDPPAP